jgi:hypothetical protein
MRCQPAVSRSLLVFGDFKFSLRLYRIRPGNDCPGPSREFSLGAAQLLERDHNVVIDAEFCLLGFGSGPLLRLRRGEVYLCRGV